MNNYIEIAHRIKQNFHYFKGDEEVKIRTLTLGRILSSINAGKTITQAAELQGVRRQYFYFWIRRLIAANFDLNALKGESKKPTRSPNATSAEVVELAKKIRKIENNGGHKVAYYLQRDHGIKIAGSTVCAIFKVASDGLTLQQFQKILDEYMLWYNRCRPHSSLKYLTPHEKFYGVRLAKTA